MSKVQWCRFDVRIGIYPDREIDACQHEIEQVIAEAVADNPYLTEHPPRLTYHGFLSNGYTLPRHTSAEGTLVDAHRAVYDADLATLASTALTDARFFGLYQDTPALVYGPVAENIHSFDERVNLESLRNITQVIALFVASWCGLEQIV